MQEQSTDYSDHDICKLTIDNLIYRSKGNQFMRILGLNLGHCATATLLKDGQIVRAVSEERFSRIKNHAGLPIQSIKWILDNEKIKIGEIDLIVLDDHYPLRDDPYFSQQFIEAYKRKRMKKIISNFAYNFPNIFNKVDKIKEKLSERRRNSQKKGLKEELSARLGYPIDKIILADHHKIHAFSTVSNLGCKDWLVLTLDGEGSGFCASVNIFRDKKMQTLSKTPKSASLGYFYALATMHMGLKPLEHEFKVMGLAPYAKKADINKNYHLVSDLFYIDKNLRFNSKFSMQFADIFFKKNMQSIRFDTFAGIVQKLTEENVIKWVKMAIKETGIRRVALSGGVFMNVKINQKIAELEEVDEIFITPSCGDESNAIGSSWYGYYIYCNQQKIDFVPNKLNSLYLGPIYDDKYVEQMVKRDKLEKEYIITQPKDIEKKVAQLLAKGQIVARFTGKSEWGARALGNRSILANPTDPDTIRILNETIKDRDFWMPFTPSLIEEYSEKYISNPKKIDAPYMVLTFDSLKDAKKDLPAAIHPYDLTVRPQIVSKSMNPTYHKLISEFAKLTGRGAILNTSFNLHGQPNVLTPEDAVYTVDNSSLNYLAVGSYLFEKRSDSAS